MSTQAENNTTIWPLRRVGLKVLDMETSIDYYTRLGFSIVRDERGQEVEKSVGLGVGTQEILSLRALVNGRRRPARTAGLFHFAILLGNEAELGSFLRYMIEKRIPLDGASDHLVSQALYMSDPEGNGIEVYADRPRDRWQIQGNNVKMDTLPIDADALLKKAEAFDGFSLQTRLGHMHLNVGELERTRTFYQNLNMNFVTYFGGQAAFLAYDGYHHHLGTNLWAGRNVQPVAADVSGIDFFEIRRAGLKPEVLHDPDGIEVRAVEVE